LVATQETPELFALPFDLTPHQIEPDQKGFSPSPAIGSLKVGNMGAVKGMRLGGPKTREWLEKFHFDLVSAGEPDLANHFDPTVGLQKLVDRLGPVDRLDRGYVR